MPSGFFFYYYNNLNSETGQPKDEQSNFVREFRLNAFNEGTLLSSALGTDHIRKITPDKLHERISDAITRNPDRPIHVIDLRQLQLEKA